MTTVNQDKESIAIVTPTSARPELDFGANVIVLLEFAVILQSDMWLRTVHVKLQKHGGCKR